MALNSKQDTAGSVTAPVLIFFLPLAIGIALYNLSPLGLITEGWLRFTIGLPVIVIAILLNGWAGTTLANSGTSPEWNKPAKLIVKHGPFKYSRNPQYVSLFILYLGIAILFNALWSVLFLPVVLLVMILGVVKREERYLEQKFGEEYLSYKKQVRRWL